VPNPARMWNYWLGGKDNFGADRQAAERVLEVMPSLPLIARAARLFLIDAVHGAAVRRGSCHPDDDAGHRHDQRSYRLPKHAR
jgi:S-adenosyl methyltransferase